MNHEYHWHDLAGSAKHNPRLFFSVASTKIVYYKISCQLYTVYAHRHSHIHTLTHKHTADGGQ